MTKGLHRTLLGILGVLLILMIVLLFHGPNFTAHGNTRYGGAEGEPAIPDTKVQCGSIVTAGWPTDNAYLNVGGTTTGYSTSYELPDGIRMSQADWRSLKAGLTQECNERRDTYLGFAILLATASCLLGSLTIAHRPTQPDLATAVNESEE
ncbi:MAG: hypothetical protein ACRDQA_29315 [Nocardioidaceae bacterium]